MKNRLLSIAVVLALVAGLIVSAAPAYASPPPPDYKPVDIGPELREWGQLIDRIKGGAPYQFTPEELKEHRSSRTMPALASADDAIAPLY